MVGETNEATVVAESTKRTDDHRRGAFKPEMYQFFAWYYLSERPRKGLVSSLMRASEEVAKYFAGVDEHGIPIVDYKAMPYGTFGKCGVCGAGFAMGEIWRHKDTNDLVHIGHDCVAKYEMAGADWDALADERRRALEARRTAARRAKAKEKLFVAYAGLEEALKADHRISRDLAGKLAQYGTLSDGQCKLALKIAAEVAERIQKRAAQYMETHVAAPTGRVTVRGMVVSLKEHEGEWGISTKMTVKVSGEGGVWLCWATVPAGLDVHKGDEVQFDAELSTGRDAHFAFGKRPTKASVVKKAEVGP